MALNVLFQIDREHSTSRKTHGVQFQVTSLRKRIMLSETTQPYLISISPQVTRKDRSFQ